MTRLFKKAIRIAGKVLGTIWAGLTTVVTRDCALCLGTGKGLGDEGQEINCPVCAGHGRI